MKKHHAFTDGLYNSFPYTWPHSAALAEAPVYPVSDLLSNSDAVYLATVYRVVGDSKKKTKSADAHSSDAKEGETILLFLTKTESGTFEITNSGQGRLPVSKSGNQFDITVSQYDFLTPEDRDNLKDNLSMGVYRTITLPQLKSFLETGVVP